jgi:prephenate dehydratase
VSVPAATTADRPRVAFSGEPGAFAEDAVLAYFDRPIAVPVPGFREVFEAVTAGRTAADAAMTAAPPAPDAAAAGSAAAAPIVAGVIPIENLVNGTVRENYDLLLEHDLVIRGEVVVPVRLVLAALPGQRLEDVERVYSHIQALGQADRFLRTRPWSLLTTYNTAGAGKMIVERGERGAAAVLSPRAAALFGLKVLADDVQNVPDNRTRFLVVTRPDRTLDAAWLAAGRAATGQPSGPDALSPVAMRTTLVTAVPNEPGVLHRLLGIFAAAGINMSKIESRPLHGRAWEYVFWIDLDADAADARARAALDELTAAVPMLRVLGCYPRGER